MRVPINGHQSDGLNINVVVISFPRIWGHHLTALHILVSWVCLGASEYMWIYRDLSSLGLPAIDWVEMSGRRGGRRELRKSEAGWLLVTSIAFTQVIGDFIRHRAWDMSWLTISAINLAKCISCIWWFLLDPRIGFVWMCVVSSSIVWEHTLHMYAPSIGSIWPSYALTLWPITPIVMDWN